MRGWVIGFLLVALVTWSAYAFWGPYQIQQILMTAQTGTEVALRAPAIVVVSGLTQEQFSALWALPAARNGFVMGLVNAMWHERLLWWAAVSAVIGFLTILAALLLPKPEND